jgi:hypothetical protein
LLLAAVGVGVGAEVDSDQPLLFEEVKQERAAAE